MTLVDTSVWIDHFRRRNAGLCALLEAGEAATHPFVIGELACGALQNRAEVLALMDSLPKVVCAMDADMRGWIESGRLWGRGIGWIDLHLLASARLSRCRLWTLDARLRRVASGAGVAFCSDA